MDKGTDQGQRLGSQIFLRGMSAQFHIINHQVDKVVNMRMLLLQTYKPVQNSDINLFRTEDNVNNPYNWTADDAMTMHRPINRMKYRILFNKVYTIGPNSAENQYRNVKHIKEFMKINRQITINTEAAQNEKCVPRFVLCFWFCNTDDAPINVGNPPNLSYARNYREFYYQ